MKCRHPSTRTRWQTFVNGTTHLREECSCCGKLRRYLPQYEMQKKDYFRTKEKDLAEIEALNIFA